MKRSSKHARAALILPLVIFAAASAVAQQNDRPQKPQSPAPSPQSSAEELPALKGVKRIVFLGDSITYAGQYVETIDAYLAARYPDKQYEVLNLGLPSETVSGLSEPGHADGKFPRPDVHERLDRVLQKTKPDFVVACYGMNCGMYYPLNDERLARFQQGMTKLHDKCRAAGAKVLHVTPPVFDPLPIKERTLPAGLDEYRKPYVGYNEVLDKFSEWLLTQRDAGWNVVDLHGPMNKYLADERKRDPAFILAKDGVHMNAAGHWLATKVVLLGLGAPENELLEATSAEDLLDNYPQGLAILKLAQQRQRILKDSWLTDVGHKRPGMRPGLPLEEAKQRAADITKQIGELATKK